MMKRRLLRLLSLIIIIVDLNTLLSPSVYAQVESICGGFFAITADASVNQGSPDVTYGHVRQLHVDRSSNREWRTLLRFDLANRIPPGATIHKAELQLNLAEAPQPLPYSLIFRNIQGTWNETSVTWNTQPAISGRYSDHTSLINALPCRRVLVQTV